VVVRQVVFPAQAAANVPVYDYKLVPMRDLIETVKAQNRAFHDADPRTAAEEGIRGFGHAGWRYAGCFKDSIFGWGGGACTVLLFEQASVGAPPPTAGRTSYDEEPPPQVPTSPSTSPMHH
jgi:hypothetical protein